MNRNVALLSLTLALAANLARAQDSAWILGTNGSWNDSANWAGGIVASGTASTAFFTGPTNLTVSQDDPLLVIGNLYFTNFNFTVSNQLITLDNGGNQPVVTVGGPVRSATLSAPLAGTNGLIAEGGGTLNLSGTNTALAGEFVIRTAVFSNNNNAGVALLNNGAIGGMTSVVVGTNAFLTLNGGVTLASNVAISLVGAGGLSAPVGTLRGTGAATVTNVVNGPIVFLPAASASVRIGNSGAGQLTLNGAITSPSTNHTLVFRFNDNNGIFITNTNNAWGGLTQLSQGGFRSLPDAMPSNTTVQIGPTGDAYWETFGAIVRSPGTAQNAHLVDLTPGATNGRAIGFSARGGTLDINLGGTGAVLKWGQSGFNPAVLHLNSTRADNTLTLANGLDFNGAMRTIRVDAATAVFAGRLTNSALTNAASFVKAGTGTLLVTATNTANGSVTIAAGTLAIDGDHTLGNTSGTPSTNLVFTGNATLQVAVATVTLPAARQIVLSTNLLATFDSLTNVLAVDGTIVGGSVAKVGGGTMALRGTNYLLGSLSANNGLLLIEGITKLTYPSNSGSPYAVQIGHASGFTGVVTVAAGATLGATNASFRIGSAANGSAILNVQPGATVITEVTPAYLATNDLGNQAHFLLGPAAGSVGVVHQSGGLVSVGNQFFIGQNAGSFGYYHLSAGSLVVTGQANPYLTAPIARFRIGAASTGLFYQTGGSVTVNTDRISMGYNANFGRGVLYVAGGTFTAPVNGLNSVNRQGARAEITVAGTGAISLGGTVSLGEVTNGELAILNLKGGSLRAANLFSPTNAGLVNFDGGLYVAGANATGFLQGLIAAQVRDGGARIDTGTFTLTAAKPLVAPAGNGITSITVSGATNYMGAPYVLITGGGGSNATAVAEIDADGTVTNIVVTSAGEDYTSEPTVALRGGGGTSGTATAAIGPNTSGGLTKLGAGTLILSNVNTYAGATTVSNGTLELRGGGSIDVSTSIVVDAGATLAVTGRTDGALTVAANQTLNGHGTVVGHVNNGGTVAPGTSAGVLNVAGNYTQTTGVLRIEIGGTTAGSEYDVLSVTNNADLGGNLSVSLTDGFDPAGGDMFAVVLAGSTTGSFATTNLPALTGGKTWHVTVIPGAVILSVTSAPSASGYDAFALQITNTALRGVQDDADGDGYANLLEYVTGGSPTNADQAARMGGTRTNGVLALRFTRDTNTVDATLVVEGAYAATDGAVWLGLATNANGLWSGAPVSEGPGNPAAVTVQDTDTTATNRFLRLRVTRP